MSEQQLAEVRLRESGLYFKDFGYGFHVGGRFGVWMSPAEVLRKVAK